MDQKFDTWTSAVIIVWFLQSRASCSRSLLIISFRRGFAFSSTLSRCGHLGRWGPFPLVPWKNPGLVLAHQLPLISMAPWRLRHHGDAVDQNSSSDEIRKHT